MTPEASHGVSGGIVGINECNSQIRLRSKRDPRSTRKISSRVVFRRDCKNPILLHKVLPPLSVAMPCW
jgi:hypothetical protein